MKNSFDSDVVLRLVEAAEQAEAIMCDSINLDLAVGNYEFEDVLALEAALDELTAALDAIRSSKD